jgi:hypothetical protein
VSEIKLDMASEKLSLLNTLPPVVVSAFKLATWHTFISQIWSCNWCFLSLTQALNEEKGSHGD